MLAGVCASDPFRRMDRFLVELERLGFDGIQNFPTVGLIDGNFRQNLEETGMGYGCVAQTMDLLSFDVLNFTMGLRLVRAAPDILRSRCPNVLYMRKCYSILFPRGCNFICLECAVIIRGRFNRELKLYGCWQCGSHLDSAST